MNLKNIPTDELFRKFAGTRLTGHWDRNNVSRGRTNMKEAAQKRKKISQEMTERFFGSSGQTPPATKYDLALELAPDVYAMQQGGPPSLALKVLLSTCLSPANPNATRDDLLRFCILKTPSVNRQTQTHLTDLPPEILIMIASFIPNLSDVAKASMTCHRLRGIFWGNNTLFRGWVTKNIMGRGRGRHPRQLAFPGVEKAYPELYYRAFLEDPIRVKSKIPWEEVAFRWFSWMLLFYNHPEKVANYINASKTIEQFCLVDKYAGYNSRLFCANCHRVPKRVYAKNTLCVSFDNSLFGFNYTTVCGICWSHSKSSLGIFALSIALEVANVEKNNVLLNHRSFRLPHGYYTNYSRYSSCPVVTIETVIHAMCIRQKAGNFPNSNHMLNTASDKYYDIHLKAKKIVAAEIERNWNGYLKKQEGSSASPPSSSSQPSPSKKPRLGNP